MRFFYKDKAFVVTGASSGIGRELASLLVSMGAKVIAVARSRDKLESLKEEVDSSNLLIMTGDVTVEADCKKAMDLCLPNFGKLDGLIHNAGISMRATAEEADMKVYESLMATNFYSMVYLYKNGIHLLRQSQGHLVGVSSMMGLFSTHLRSAYCASKHALQGYLDSIRLENMEAGVHVMTVVPGFVKTNITKNALTANGSIRGEDSTNTEAGLEPEEVAMSILEGIMKRKRDVFPSRPKEKVGLFLSKWAPNVLDKIISSSHVT
ncbi:MAG: SDR family oxidoreductase [Leptospirales bacterium]|nr:SDR family oxidoreductase [Leptospirales bacterium]